MTTGRDIVKLLIFLLVVWLIAAAIGVAPAASVTVAWEPNPVSDAVTSYELSVVEVFGIQKSVYPVTETRATVTGLTIDKPYLFTVRAKSAVLWSDPSDPLTVIPVRKMTFQFSTDLTNWQNIKTVTGPKGFMRIIIEE